MEKCSIWNVAKGGILNDDSEIYSLDIYSGTMDFEMNPATTDEYSWYPTADEYSWYPTADEIPSYFTCKALNYPRYSETFPVIIDSTIQRHDDTQDPPPFSQIIK
jgi:hypothetical protein